MRPAWALALMLACVAPLCAQTQQATRHAPETSSVSSGRSTPEASTGWQLRPPVFAERHLAVTANPHATRAAVAILEAGGNAVDAAIAAQMVLGLVEPQSSGIGGGAFLLLYEARTGRVLAFDGRETAPARAAPELFLRADGTPMGFFEAAIGGRAVGVPGAVRMLERVHAKHGALAWPKLFEPAIRLARDGFEVSDRLHALLERDRWLREDPAAAAYFYDGAGRPWPRGHRLRNEALADTLEQIAARGGDALHTGPIARDIVAAVAAPPNPGVLDARDLAAYAPVERAALCVPYRVHRVCGMPPPSSGAIAIAQMLAFWRLAGPPVRLADPRGTPLVDGVHRFTEAARLAFADRNEYVADTDFVALPGQRIGEAVRTGPGTLLDPGYLTSRARLIGERSMGTATPGAPAPSDARLRRLATHEFEPASTTHLSIVDADGNAVAMTSSIESAFGSRRMVRGFLLNNHLTDFAFVPRRAGAPVANRIAPGKRPRSSMSPTLVLDARSGEPVLAVGSPGGPSIVAYVARTLIAVLEDGVGLADAVAMPNFGSRNGPTELETGRVDATLAEALAARGHEIEWREMTSGVHAIRRHCRTPERCTLEGAVDPRREGLALGR